MAQLKSIHPDLAPQAPKTPDLWVLVSHPPSAGRAKPAESLRMRARYRELQRVHALSVARGEKDHRESSVLRYLTAQAVKMARGA